MADQTEPVKKAYRVVVDSPIASEVEISDCAREPRPGMRFRVALSGSVIDFGIIVSVEEIDFATGRPKTQSASSRSW